MKRVNSNKGFWFDQGVAKEVEVSKDGKTLDLLIECKGIRGRDFDECQIVPVLANILGGSRNSSRDSGGSRKDKDTEVASSAGGSRKDKRVVASSRAAADVASSAGSTK